MKEYYYHICFPNQGTLNLTNPVAIRNVQL